MLGVAVATSLDPHQPIPPIGLTRQLSIPLTQPEFFSDGDTYALIIFRGYPIAETAVILEACKYG